MKARPLGLKIVVAALALTASSLWAQDGLEGALARMSLTAPVSLGTLFSQTVATADFDGDQKPDGAILLDHGGPRSPHSSRQIELHFTGRSNTILTFESIETALAISALDVNGDGATDIVVEHPLTHKRVRVWLNDGRGGFHEGRIEDFPSGSPSPGERLASPAPQANCPALCLGPQRGSEPGSLTAHPFLCCFFSDRNQALSSGSAIRANGVATSSPRAPPLSRSL